MGNTKKGWMLLAIYIATFMTAIESTIVVTAANAISKSFAGDVPISLLFSSYLFSSALATPILSRLADQYGKKRVFLFGLFLFIVGTFLCGISTSFSLLILFRVLKGIGAGGIMPITFALIGDLFDFETRGKIMGLNNSAWGIASLVAPLLGGFLVSQLSWHWVFFINIPFGLLTILIVQFFYKEEKKSSSTKFSFNELKQYLFLTVSLFLVLVGIQVLTTNLGFGGLFFVAGIILLYTFLLSERKQTDPVLPIEAFKASGFLLFTMITFLINGVLIGFQVYVPLWIQTEMHLSPTFAGLALLPSSIFFITGSFFSAQLGKRFGRERLLIFCLAVNIAVFAVLGVLPQHAPYLAFLLLACFSGFGIGTTVTTSVLSAQSAATGNNIGAVSGFITLFRTLGQSFMITFFGMIFSLFAHSSLSTTGYHAVFFSAALIVLLSLLLVYFATRITKGKTPN